jgi:hypothetical protein
MKGKWVLTGVFVLELLLVLATGWGLGPSPSASLSTGLQARALRQEPLRRDERWPQAEASTVVTEESEIRPPDVSETSAPSGHASRSRSFPFDPGHRIGDAETIEAIAIGDLDWDARPDLVSAGGSHLLVWQNPASPFASTWVSQSVGPVTAAVYAVALGDLDNDGYLDLVSGHAFTVSHELQLWQNDATPFDDPWPLHNAGTLTASVHSLVVDDLDRDGDLDVVSGDGNGQVQAWENAGTPFSTAWTSNRAGTTPGAGTVLSLIPGDLNNDGNPDVVSGDSNNRVIAWLNLGTPFSGAWYSRTVSTAADAVEALALADLDGDGYLDIVAGCGSGEDYEVIAWQNDGTFYGNWTQHDVATAGVDVYAIASADFDVDGDPDLASGSQAHVSFAEVRSWENDGAPFVGTWGGTDVGETGADVRALVAADLDQDGDPDLVAATDGQIEAWPNQRTPYWGTWTEGAQPSPTYAALSVDLVDFDHDGDLDIAAGTDGHGVNMWRGDGGYGWTQEGVGQLPDAGMWPGVTWGWLDDGASELDLVAASQGDGLRAWKAMQFGWQWWDISTGLPTSGSYHGLTLGHVDHDGLLDMVAYGSGLGVQIWQLSGSNWITQTVLSNTLDFCDASMGWVDRDGDPDIVAASCSGAGIPVWLGDGGFGFARTTPVTTGGSYEAVALGDLDRDGDADVAAAPTTGGVRVWLGDGGAAWTDKGIISPTLSVLSLDLNDFERDGYPDLAVGTDGDGIRVWRGDGGETWTETAAGLPITGTFRDVAFGRVDGNGLLDIVAAADDGVHVYFSVEPPPGGWTDFQPAGWVTAAPVTSTVRVADAGAGLAVSTAAVRITADCDAPTPHWSGWTPALCSGITGTTALQSITATVPFTQDSAAGNCVQFRIQDTSGLTGTSPVYLVRLDTVPPTNPVLSSTTHQPSTWHNSRSIRVAWEGASDATSGVGGYSYLLDTSPATLPDETSETWPWASSAQVQAPADGTTWRFHLRTRDQAGNWSPTAVHLGPFGIDTQPPTNCSIDAPDTVSETTFLVTWSCEDTGSTVDIYNVEAREGYAPWQPWVETWYLFTGGYYTAALEYTPYHFRVRATDRAGNSSAYAYTDGTVVQMPPPTVDLLLSIDDAAPGVAVNKLIPDAGGLADHTRADVVVRLEPDAPIDESFVLRLLKPSELGSPVSVRVHTDPSRLGGGTEPFWYESGDIVWVDFASLTGTRTVVFRFEIAPGAATGSHQVQAEVLGSSATGSSNQATLHLMDYASALILTNRTCLFQEFTGDPGAVRSLLQTLYGLSGTRVVYYVDDYSTDARDWDPLAVTYWNASTNSVANVVDNLVEDWANDGSPHPTYLLLVGDDPIIPYYRVDDPIGSEQDHAYHGVHPILDALTQHDGFFSDAKYADLDDDDWQKRPADLAVGRIVGLTPDDMLNFVQSGREGPDVGNQTFVAASRDGRDFGVEGTVRSFGFDILYDGQGEPWDMVDTDSWTYAELVAAMENEFAAFGFADHGEHDGVATPGGFWIGASIIDALSADGGNYADTHPFFGIHACRVGFALGASTSYTDSLMYALVHEGASGVAASMGISYSDANWDARGHAERFMQCLWNKLLPAWGSRATGVALREARANYDKGIRWDSHDKKTIMEYTLFGLPWVAIPDIPPSVSALAVGGKEAAPLPFSPVFEPPQPTGITGTYSIRTALDASHYAVFTDVVPGFDVLQIEGLDLSGDANLPMLPVALYTMTLPADAEIVSVGLVTDAAVILVGLNLPVFVPVSDTLAASPGTAKPLSAMTLFPTQPYTYDVATAEDTQRVRVYISPAAYDSDANQATLYQSMTLTVTYHVTHPVVLDGIHPGRVPQPPDQPVILEGAIMNVGSQPITLTPQIELSERTGHTWGPQASPPVAVPPGGSTWMTASFSPTGELPDGPYLARLTLWRGPITWTETSVDVDVTGGQVIRLRGPEVAWPGETAVFTMTFRNNRSEDVSLVPWLVVHDLDGMGIASLSGVTQTVSADGETTFTLTWPSVAGGQGRRAASALAARVLGGAIGDVYGPVTWFVDLPRRVYLPVLFKNAYRSFGGQSVQTLPGTWRP